MDTVNVFVKHVSILRYEYCEGAGDLGFGLRVKLWIP